MAEPHVPDPVADALTGPVLVAGAGTAGMSAVRHLVASGRSVTVVDDAPSPAVIDELGGLGVAWTGADDLLADESWAARHTLLVVSPGFAPTNRLVVAAGAADLPVWGEVELAWHVDHSGLFGAPRTWLVVTGTNGKTTTTSMLADIVEASGRTGAACGNIGLPVLDAMAISPRVEVLCVEMSSFQLHWAPSVRADAGVVLNVAEDHLDWHGSFDAYAQAKAGALTGAVGIVGLDDEVAARLQVAGRRVGFRLSAPDDGELGIVDGELTDRAFGSGALLPAAQINPPGPSGLADALAAGALALAAGVERDAVVAGLRAFRPAAHRGEVVAECEGIAFVDDSKATNPHAAQAAIAAHRRVVLIAGGLLKGASVDGLLTSMRPRLAGIVAIGRDRDLIVEAIARHAPEVPTVTVFTGDDGGVNVHRADIPTSGPVTDVDSSDPAVAVMDRAVDEAWQLAQNAHPRPDAVLLAPAAASLDMFAGYGVRGDAFAAAARRVAQTGAARP